MSLFDKLKNVVKTGHTDRAVRPAAQQTAVAEASQPAPAAVAEQPVPQPVAAADGAAAASDAGGTFTLRSLLAAIAPAVGVVELLQSPRMEPPGRTQGQKRWKEAGSRMHRTGVRCIRPC